MVACFKYRLPVRVYILVVHKPYEKRIVSIVAQKSYNRICRISRNKENKEDLEPAISTCPAQTGKREEVLRSFGSILPVWLITFQDLKAGTSLDAIVFSLKL